MLKEMNRREFLELAAGAVAGALAAACTAKEVPVTTPPAPELLVGQ